MPKTVTASVIRRFPFAAGRVFDAWLDPVWIGRWMFGNRPHGLVFTWATRDALPETRTVTVLIEPLSDSACQLTLHHEMSAACGGK